MSVRREGMRLRKCGCIYYDYGPPVKCAKHEAKHKEQDEKGLRKAVREQAANLNHVLTMFSEYESYKGKWTAYCERCGKVIIVYDEPPVRGDQVNGKAILEKECSA